MRISINLATRPFVELKPVLVRLRLAMALLALLAVGLSVWLYLWGRRERAAAEQMDALVRQTDAFRQERAANESRMRQPENRTVLERAQFLNGVFAQKAFSWTSVMMELERVLPAGVQVTNIEPAVAANGDVTIHLRVSGPRELAVELIRNLEKSRQFLQPRLMNETAQTQETGRAIPVNQGVPGGVQFDILSGYNPLPEVKKDDSAEAPAAAKAAVVKGGPAPVKAAQTAPGNGGAR